MIFFTLSMPHSMRYTRLSMVYNENSLYFILLKNGKMIASNYSTTLNGVYKMCVYIYNEVKKEKQTQQRIKSKLVTFFDRL